MKLIVGLGNPGKKYEDTRHNVGFIVLDKLAEKKTDGKWLTDKKFEAFIIKHSSSTILAKPQTFMNESGDAVAAIVNFYKLRPTDIYVIHDDLDIRLGEYKIQQGVGPKQHYGIASIEEKLSFKEFWRVRIGVDNREQDIRIPGEEYVLQRFSSQEVEIIKNITDSASSQILSLLD